MDNKNGDGWRNNISPSAKISTRASLDAASDTAYASYVEEKNELERKIIEGTATVIGAKIVISAHSGAKKLWIAVAQDPKNQNMEPSTGSIGVLGYKQGTKMTYNIVDMELKNLESVAAFLNENLVN